jgi:hypothetical protein
MHGKLSIGLGVGVVMLVLMTMAVYMANAGNLDPIEILIFVLVMLIVMGTLVILMNKSRNMKAGLPLEDELAKKVAWKAGYYAYLSSVWVAVGALWYNTLFGEKIGARELSAEHVVGLVVLLPGAVFIGLSLYFNRKGDI